MDISRAVTDSYVNYHIFHENLNTRVKIITASLWHTLEHLNLPGNKDKMGTLIKNADPSWKYPPVFSLDDHSDTEIYNYVSELAIFGSFSALDDSLINTDADLERWEHFNNSKKNTERGSKEELPNEKIEKFYARHNWSVDNISSFLPIFKYFHAIRNCIAHRNSISSSELELVSNSKCLFEAVKAHFPKGDSFPVFSEGDQVILNPKITLLCSHVIRLICKDINHHVVNEIKEEGLMYMACHHTFFKQRPEKTPAKSNAETVLNSILVHRYKIGFDDKKEALLLAKKMNLWKRCLNEYEKIYETS